MDYPNDNEMGQRGTSSGVNFVGIIALLAVAAAAGLLWWMNMGLSKRVSDLEENLANLQIYVSKHNHTRELADLSNQLQDITDKLSKHLQSLAAGQPSMPDSASSPTAAEMPDNAAITHTMPASSEPQTAPVQPAPMKIMPSQPPSSTDNGELPPPISSATEAAPTTGKAETNPGQSETTPAPKQTQTMPAPEKAAPASKQADATPINEPKVDGWVINIVSVSSEKSAAREVARLHKLGVQAESVRAEAKGKVWYRIYLPGFATHDAANNARPALEAKLGIHDTWVGKGQ